MLKKVNGRWKFDKNNAIIAGILTLSLLMAAGTAIVTQCEECIAMVQKKFVEPVAERVFDEKIETIRENDKQQTEDIKTIIEMLKNGLPDGDKVYKDARDRIENTGKFKECDND